MNILPIVQRELTVNARRPATYNGRLVVAGVCIVMGMGSAFAMARTGFSNRLGSALFASVAGMTAMFGLFIGAGSTADCISGEKRDGTLGLLFLTHLRTPDIVLGKLAASALVSFYGLMTVFPILSLGVLLGGVQFGQVVHMALALLNTLFFAAAIGILTSTLSRRPERAGLAASGAAAFFWFGCGGLAQVATQYNLWPGLVWFLRTISPQYPVELALGAASTRGGSWFWTTLLSSHALGWLCLGVACLILPRAWQDRVAGAKGLPWSERLAQRRLGCPDRRRSHRRAALGINPFFWLAARPPRRHHDVWILLLCVVLGFLGFSFWPGVDADRLGVGLVGLASLHLALRFWMANEAGQRVAEERQNGTLELVLSTPLSISTLVQGQWLAFRKMFGWPLIAVSAADLLLLALIIGFRPEAEFRSWATFLIPASILVLWLDAPALFWTALWAALTEKKAQAVGGNAIVRVLFLPWLILFGLMMLAALLSAGGAGPPFSSQSFAGLWLALSIGNSVFWIVRCRPRVLAEFRTRALDRYLAEEEKPGWIIRLARDLGRGLAPLRNR